MWNEYQWRFSWSTTNTTMMFFKSCMTFKWSRMISNSYLYVKNLSHWQNSLNYWVYYFVEGCFFSNLTHFYIFHKDLRYYVKSFHDWKLISLNLIKSTVENKFIFQTSILMIVWYFWGFIKLFFSHRKKALQISCTANCIRSHFLWFNKHINSNFTLRRHLASLGIGWYKKSFSHMIS